MKNLLVIKVIVRSRDGEDLERMMDKVMSVFDPSSSPLNDELQREMYEDVMETEIMLSTVMHPTE